MRLEEVLPALREGKKIRRKSRKREEHFFVIKDGSVLDEHGYNTMLYVYGLQADDWEIVKEKKKVKLRDLTEEQYKKWFYANCCSKNKDKSISDCFVCVFHNAICNPESNRCWAEHKDLYSDKFLDREIEVEE